MMSESKPRQRKVDTSAMESMFSKEAIQPASQESKKNKTESVDGKMTVSANQGDREIIKRTYAVGKDQHWRLKTIAASKSMELGTLIQQIFDEYIEKNKPVV